MLLLDAARAHLPRWRRTLRAPGAPRRRALVAQLVFVPRMPHARLLALVAGSDAMLDPFPWGAGVTAFEAFSVCAPVVALPARTTVLQLTLGQYRAMRLARDAPFAEGPRGDARGEARGEAHGEALLAANVSEYVAIAARLGEDAAFRDAARRRICERKHRLFDDDAAVGEWASFLERAVGELVD